MDFLIQEHQRAARRLREELDAWQPPRKQKTSRGLDPERAYAMRALVEGYLDRQQSALRSAVGAAGLALVDSRRKIVESTVQAERSWQFCRAVLGQRRDLQVGELLGLADACARDGFEAYRVAAQGAAPGEEPPPRAPPFVWLEAISSAATFPRDAMPKSAGLVLAATQLPVPVVLLPPDHLTSIWQWSALQHEIGHVLDRDFGITTELVQKLSGVFGFHAPEWRAWMGEIVADLFGVLLGGAGFAWSLLGLLEGQCAWERWDGVNDVHPPAQLRVRLLAQMLERRGEAPAGRGPAELLAAAPPPAGAAGKVELFASEAKKIVDAMFDEKLSALGGARIPDGGPAASVDARHVAYLAERLRGDVQTKREAPIRLVAGAAQLRALELKDPSAAELDLLHERALKLLREAPRKSGESSAEKWQFLRVQVAAMEAPILTPERLKVPPVELLLGSNEISFVGATHGQLATRVREALAAKPGKRWRQLEVFFLAKARLPSLAHGETTADDLEKEWSDAKRELEGLLPQVSDAGGMFEFDEPFLFASYWDAHAPGGRIHVSQAVWGENLRTCPAIDHLWEGGVASPAYETFLRGLGALRESEQAEKRVRALHAW